MKNVSRLAASVFASCTLALTLGLASPAVHALVITPGSCSTSDNSNFGANEVEALALSCFGSNVDLTLAYKANVGPESTGGLPVTEEGPFAAVYETTFLATPGDPSGALIEYVSGVAISCPTCFLLVKDGNQDPAQYLFDLSAWNGTDDLDLSGFWPNQGAISNIAIWVGPQIPRLVGEPGSLVLLGLGLLAAGLAKRRRA